MGLDMTLRGRKYFFKDYTNPENDMKIDGFDVNQAELELGYWRKHPDLHGFIVREFADGRDECQPIDLEPRDIQRIIDAVSNDELPKTSGFFFGESTHANEQDTLEKLRAALEWVNSASGRDVYYQASW